MKKNLVTSLLLLGASVSVAVGEEMKPKRFLSPRDAMPFEDMFMNGVMAKAKVKRDEDRVVVPVIPLADPPHNLGLGGRSLVARQWGCESVGQINCVFKGCCSQGTVCGVYGGEQGCCPIGKTCSGVGSCKTTEITCGSGCCPRGARCTTDSDGSDACDYTGASSSISVKSATSTSRVPSSTSTSDSSCPANYSPCTGTDVCCPAGVKCLPNKKCDISCEATDPICGTGCCKPGTQCNTLTSTCFQSDESSGSGGSSSTRRTSSKATTSSTRPSSTPPAATTTAPGSGSGSGSSSTSTPGSSSGSGSGSGTGTGSSSGSGPGTGGLTGTPSGASNLVVSMGITVLVGVLGIAML